VYENEAAVDESKMAKAKENFLWKQIVVIVLVCDLFCSTYSDVVPAQIV